MLDQRRQHFWLIAAMKLWSLMISQWDMLMQSTPVPLLSREPSLIQMHSALRSSAAKQLSTSQENHSSVSQLKNPSSITTSTLMAPQIS